MWESEGDLHRRTLVEIYYDVKKKRLPWDEYRTPMFSESTMDILYSTCEEYGIEPEMMNKLIVAVEENKHYSRGNKVGKAFDRIINEGWLHHEFVKGKKAETKVKETNKDEN